MGDTNNFKNLMNEEERSAGEPSKKIEENVDYKVGFASFSGNVFETFFSTVFGVFISMSGGDSDISCFRKNGKERMSNNNTPDQRNNGPVGKP